MTDYPILAESTRQDDGYVHKCGTTLHGAPIAHPIHDGPFPLSGSGEVWMENVPYCPTCDPKPQSSGIPLKRHPADIADEETLRRIRNL